MSKAAGGSESASKGPRRRQPRRGPGKLDVFEPDDYAPGGFKNTFPGDPRESKRARSTGKKSLAEDVEQAAPQVLASVEAVLREYKDDGSKDGADQSTRDKGDVGKGGGAADGGAVSGGDMGGNGGSSSAEGGHAGNSGGGALGVLGRINRIMVKSNLGQTNSRSTTRR